MVFLGKHGKWQWNGGISPWYLLLQSGQRNIQGGWITTMAELMREGDTIILRLSVAEKLEGIHGDLHTPVASIESMTIVDDVIHAIHGIRTMGTSIPGVVAMGTFWSGSETVFAIVHHHNTRGIRVNLRGGHYGAWIVGVDDPGHVIAQLGI